jgi:hypothetical protein
MSETVSFHRFNTLMTKPHLTVTFAVGLMIALVCQAETLATPPVGRLIFQSGFEKGSVCAPTEKNPAISDITGSDESLAAPNNWVTDLEDHPQIGSFQIQSGSYNPEWSKVDIITEPGKTNQVLRYWMQSPNEAVNAAYGGKFRIQTGLIGNQGLREFSYQVRLFLTDDWLELTQRAEPMEWFIVQEFWNNANWTREAYPFRIHLVIHKDAGVNAPLHFGIEAEAAERTGGKMNKVWVAPMNTTFAVPIGRWMEMNVYLKEGDREQGRYHLTVKPEGEKPVMVYDVRNFTHHPDDPAPDGFAQINPMKGYSHRDNILHVKSHGKALQFYWDDFRFLIHEAKPADKE